MEVRRESVMLLQMLFKIYELVAVQVDQRAAALAFAVETRVRAFAGGFADVLEAGRAVGVDDVFVEEALRNEVFELPVDGRLADRHALLPEVRAYVRSGCVVAGRARQVLEQTASGGVYQGPSGLEKWYNKPMDGVVDIMRHLGFNEVQYPYWVRDDGCKMLGDYIILAANLEVRPRGTILETSRGTGIVCDCCVAADADVTLVDVAVDW